ncbi:N-acetylmuramoyl-L-alanine amidase [Eubacterium multiforme]|uniref:N-acetylmuramoyl-L-alanine amidase/uncharacterized protein YraI n=1 Tax=Eubacterium multiforme TaxID=83339 RepID=A0ABT9UVY2_9FIRM|nr:N-acetylmuramoyl-L-alanine amidase [Eubacterium multiforme]MDQ0150487.1 N-acetylmuramoyl-L-alanine amidase/uncharacterized protein YraI [Eubacterium multiforme]
MKREKLKRIIKTTLFMLAISLIPIGGKITDADSKVGLENQFLSVINGYDREKVIVENGVSLKFGETLDLSKYRDFKMSNKYTVDIKDGIVIPKKEGTVYLSKKNGDKLHVIEVYVSNSKEKYYLKNNKVDRNYYKVFIDPGHGGHDDGSSAFGLKEDELNLKIGLKIQKRLEDKGIEVKMSRSSDEYISLIDRSKMANEYGADLLVSNHINSFTSGSAHGIETYYHKNKSKHKPLSDNIQNNSIKETGAYNRGVKNANFAVLRESEMPSSLFEGGFISNKTESAKLKDDKYQDKLAKAVADGIEKYLKDNIKLNEDTNVPEDSPDNDSNNKPEEKPDNKPNNKPEEKPQEKPENVTKSGTVTASSLNVRSGPSTKNSIKGSLKRGSKVEILSSTKGWHKIKYKNSYGYVSADYVKINNSNNNSGNSSNNKPQEKPETIIKSGTVIASSLNVRSSASTKGSIKGSLKRGSKVEIVSTSKGWHKIKYKGGYAYVSADYVKTNNSSSSNKPSSNNKIGKVTASSLNIRKGPSTKNSIIGSLKRGSKVEIVSTSKGWHKIKYKNGYGYVSADYIRF